RTRGSDPESQLGSTARRRGEGPARCDADPGATPGRRGAASPRRTPGTTGGVARGVDDLPNPGLARRRPPRPEESHRRRAALSGRLRRDEQARREHPALGALFPVGGHRPTRSTLHRDGEAGPGGAVATETKRDPVARKGTGEVSYDGQRSSHENG